ncbi:ascorbate transporter, chloroplastic-like [Anneissia japonica]|uniref:ascorbate transporter, chloroplastic-like n=1 Tax=Anneissia japonica TaxID=1529436 RepID=UPI0014259E43|nr:ascorbate transporter, chloroplastic-like [Anneissia japonica]
MFVSGARNAKIVGLCSLANFINAADRVIMPIAVVPMSDTYSWNLQVQGWILSAFAWGYISSQVIGGKAAQKFGGKIVLLLAVSIWSASTFLTPILAEFFSLLVFSRAILGFAEGFCLPTIFHIFANNIQENERSRAFGWLVALGSVGQMLASVICPHMNWPMMFYTFGMLGFIWVAVWIVFYKDHIVSQQEDLIPPKVDTRATVRWTSYISHRALWAIYAAHFAMNWSNYIVMSWLPTYLQRHLGADAKDISLTALPYVMNSFVGVIAGYYADSLISKKQWTVLSVRRLMTSIGLLGPALFLLLFSYVDNIGLAVCFVSISLGLCACNSSGHISNHADVAASQAGITFAVSNTLATIPGLAAGPVTAAIVEYSSTWYPVFITASGVNIIGALIYYSQSSASQIL